MKIAVEGCAHGELDMIYSSLEDIQRRDNIKIDLLLCCGDFQAVRNEVDLQCMAVPPKYRSMCSFYKYYSGEKKAPILTVFIGGNHEASNHLWELPFGGWVAPNIYYLGYAGVVNFGGLRIAGLSGIYKHYNYHKGHFESPPFDKDCMRSIYHVRSFDAFKLKLLSNPVNIVMSHDWPRGVYHYGNLDALFRWKGFLRDEVESNTLGNSAAEEILSCLQPEHWFSAHLHVRFVARVQHSQTSKVTNFLALDKCLPKRKYLEVIDVGPVTGPLELSYDTEWLAITKLTLPLLNTQPSPTQLPRCDEDIAKLKPTQDAIKEVSALFENDLRIPQNFKQSVPLYNPANHKRYVHVAASHNPQTDEFCQKLKIRNPFWTTDLVEVSTDNPDEISLSDEDEGNSEESETLNSALSQSSTGPVETKEYASETDASATKVISQENESTADSAASKPEESCSDYEPPSKTFKLIRRNQAIYTTTDDSDG